MIFVRIRKKNVKYFTNLISVCYFYTKIINTPIILLLEPFINHLKPLEMKRSLLFVFYFFILSTTVSAGGGIFETYMSFSLNGGSEFYHGTGGGNPSLQGAVLGLNLDLNTSTLVMKLRGINSWNDGGCEVTSANINYRVYRNSDPAPGFTTLSLNFNGSAGNDKYWSNNSPDINLLAGLTSIGTYNFEVYFDAPTNASGGCDPVIYANNGGPNYIGTFSVSTALPVKINSFIVKNKKEENLISWQTSSEINNNYFEVQYSEDGKTFQSIGKVDGSGNSSRMTQYEFMHENPTAGTSYYRLKQVDFDGKFEYSPVKSIYVSEADVRIFPNPVTDMLHFSGLDDQPRDLIIKDMTGKEVYSVKELSASSLDISELKNGMYIIYLISPHRTKRERLLKQ